MIREPRAHHGARRILDAQRHHERRVAFRDIGVLAHPGDLLIERQRDGHGLGEFGAENRLGAVGDEGAITLVAAARVVDGIVALGHDRLQQQHRQHAQRQEGLQLVGVLEGTEAARGGQCRHRHGDARGDCRAARPAEHRDPHQHRVDDVGTSSSEGGASMRSQEHGAEQQQQYRERRVGSRAAAAHGRRHRNAMESDGQQQRRDDERAEEIAYPPALHTEPEIQVGRDTPLRTLTATKAAGQGRNRGRRREAQHVVQAREGNRAVRMLTCISQTPSRPAANLTKYSRPERCIRSAAGRRLRSPGSRPGTPRPAAAGQ